jgi:hypothetical protein
LKGRILVTSHGPTRRTATNCKLENAALPSAGRGAFAMAGYLVLKKIRLEWILADGGQAVYLTS